jgi:hypothetical protein
LWVISGELGHHLALEHGDSVDGGLLGQSLGGSSGMNGLQDFTCLAFSSAMFLSFSHCLARTRRAARFFDSAVWASGIISFLPLAGKVGAVAMDWAKTMTT